MMKTMTQDSSGNFVVSEVADGGKDVEGKPIAAVNTWRMRPDQAEKHLTTFERHNEKLSTGDASAVRDAANEFNKQRNS